MNNDKPKPTKNKRRRRKKTSDKPKPSKAKKPEAAPKPPRPNYLKAPSIRPEIAKAHGARVARIIADAIKGESITASISWHHVSTSELRVMSQAEIITGGFNDKGRRDHSPIICNV